ncbi:PIN domain-containing protein [uncultured Chitinophaga sp.]|uniref:PIN domain-containing protein n=1 Tax=uncultured Chitinophaga sp. TaxID=339340 RepID=UPI0025EF9641|nr:PIN domain-containing protein [uncultured Chitinophaga sp.]
MRVLLDTNIIIHREAAKVRNEGIGILFNWLDKLQATKCIHPLSVTELEKHTDPSTVRTMSIKIASYNMLKTQAPFEGEVSRISKLMDKTANDITDSKLLAEVFHGRIDFLISEDKHIHRKAGMLNISEKVYKIDSFLEKVTAEHPELVNYKVLAVKKQHFGDIDLSDCFFDSFRVDYHGFDNWFKRKSDEIAYVCYQNDVLSAFLFLKVEGQDENYADIVPVFTKKKRLKIGTFKVTSNGYKLGERFLKIIFDNAYIQRVTEIYVTIFNKTAEQKRLISLLEDWGFKHHGCKTTPTGDEAVYVRIFDRNEGVNIGDPKLTYPFLSRTSKFYMVAIYPAYHSELFPDSILNTESPANFVENQPHRNALSKVFITRSHDKSFQSGDIVLFYRTGDTDPKVHSSVVTTIGVIESVVTDIRDEAHFIEICRKRSVFTDDELRKHWNYHPYNRPFVVNFLYVASLPKRPNLKWLLDNGAMTSIADVPRGFKEFPRESFDLITKYAYKK